MSKREDLQSPIVGDPIKREKRKYLNTIEVDNRVLWVNPDFVGYMPFDIQMGKRCKLGQFFTSEIDETGNQTKTEVMREHNRSALLARVVFADKQGKLYRDADTKGGGGMIWEYDVDTPEVVEVGSMSSGYSTYGICDLDSAKHDRNMSEMFYKHGMRTNRTLAILSLREIVVEGKKISVTEAKKRGIVKKNEQAALQERAYGTKARIANLASELKADYFNDARTMVAQELGLDPSTFTTDNYLVWFAETLGKQLAILHSHNHYHGFLTTHNITLDCRITDFDSVKSFDKTSADGARLLAGQDISNAVNSFEYLCIWLTNFRREDALDGRILSNLLLKSYQNNLRTGSKASTATEVRS